MAGASLPKSEIMADPSAVSEHDVDSICGMLMQLESEMGDHEKEQYLGKCSLRITRQEKAEIVLSGGLASVMLSETNVQEKEIAIKQILESEEVVLVGDSHRGVNSRDGRGRTPLMYALAEASAPIIQILIKYERVDYLIRDQSGNTALMYASVRGYDSIVRLFMNEFKKKYQKDSATLLDYLDAENDDGDTAFTLALKNGHEDCAIALSEYLKEALEKEERRVNSLAYRIGLRGKHESRMPSTLSLREEAMTKTESPEFQASGPDGRRRRSASPKARGEKSAVFPSIRGNSLIGRRGKNASRYYAADEISLLDSEKMEFVKGSPEIRRASPISQSTVGININLDVRVDHHHHHSHHYSKMGGRSRSEKSKYKVQVGRCEKKKTEEEQPLCKAEYEPGKSE